MEGTKGSLLLLQKRTSANIYYMGLEEMPVLKEEGKATLERKQDE